MRSEKKRSKRHPVCLFICLFIHAFDWKENDKERHMRQITEQGKIAKGADRKVVFLILFMFVYVLLSPWSFYGDGPFQLGQFYTISIQDSEEYDGDIHSVVRIAFHEDAHRKLAARYWSFWLSQQSNPKTARALDIGKFSFLPFLPC